MNRKKRARRDGSDGKRMWRNRRMMAPPFHPAVSQSVGRSLLGGALERHVVLCCRPHEHISSGDGTVRGAVAYTATIIDVSMAREIHCAEEQPPTLTPISGYDPNPLWGKSSLPNRVPILTSNSVVGTLSGFTPHTE